MLRAGRVTSTMTCDRPLKPGVLLTIAAVAPLPRIALRFPCRLPEREAGVPN